MPPVVHFVLHAITWCRVKLAGTASTASPLRVVSQLHLGGKKSLALVEADGVRFLIGGSADNVTIIVPIIPATPSVQESAARIGDRSLEEAGTL